MRIDDFDLKGKAMANNTSSGMAIKGSKLRMQQVANNSLWSERLNVLLQDELQWLSPLAKTNFLEYQLNQEELLKFFMATVAEANTIFSFWPRRQPAWDGIAMGKQGTLYLFVAHSHLKEKNGKLAAADPKNRELIKQTMQRVQETYFPQAEFSLWVDGYYQIANKLTFLRMFQERERILRTLHLRQVKLVFLNFANDVTLGKMAVDEQSWQQYWLGQILEEGTEIPGVLELLTGKKQLPKDMLLVNFNITNGVMKLLE